MSEDNLTRRRMLQLTGSAAAIGLAGCAGAPASDGQNQAQAADEPQTETEAAEESHDDSESGHGDEEEGHSDQEDGHGDEGHGHDESVGAPTDTAEVKMVTTDNGYHFEPHVVRVNVGGTVTFHNESGTHSTTAYHPDNDQPQLVPDGAASWDSGILSEEGATFEHTFETEGVYHYYCTPHEALGMIATVIVGEPEAHGQPALENMPSDKPEEVQNKLKELNEMANKALGHEH
ncbi:plastocyanin/azurin family copper-binding protein [Haloferax sp. ATB1]|uniref:cupredoxin domain-containing protein n=1 Tax=Haloferax sp. ATB1 TaxID=1508454 RepID=UPI0005B2300B|nr:plastocyanin/azurin family copper-binding protein [Haloferax sp. ATB1]